MIEDINQITIAVFDFDETIVSKDTFYEFLKWLTKRSKARTLALFFATPFIVLLALSKKTRIYGINLWLIIGTYKLRSSLVTIGEQFLNHYLSNSGMKVYPDALREIERHQGEKRQVLIISATPEWLVKALLKQIELHGCKVVGSQQEAYRCGLLISQYCRGIKKVEIATERGFPSEHWEFGYGDSKSDLAFLKKCRYRFLINPNKSTLSYADRKLHGNYEVKKWL